MKLPFGMTERGVAGAGIFLLTVVVIAALIWNPALGDSDLFKTLSQAIVVQGLVGLSMAYWFTASKNEKVDQGPVAPDAPAAANAVADAARNKAEEIEERQ